MNLDTVKLIVQLLPLVVQLIQQAESLLPQGGQGQVKLAMVKGWLSALVDGTDQLWPTIEKLVAVTVATFNKLGVFQKG